MVKMYPLKLPNVKECMLKVETKGDIVIGKFYSLVNENADKNDVDNRYHTIPFYVKQLKQSDYPEHDYVDWVYVFCELCKEEHEDEDFTEKVNKLEGEEKERLLEQMNSLLFANEHILKQLNSSTENEEYISSPEEFASFLKDFKKENETRRKNLFSDHKNLIGNLALYLEDRVGHDTYLPIETATELIGLTGINPLLRWVESGKLSLRGNNNKTVLSGSLIELIKNDKEVQQYILQVNGLNHFSDFDLNEDELE